MIELPKGLERRMVHRLLHHWRDARSERLLPSLAHLLAQDLGDIRPHILVLNVSADAREPVFETIGAAFADEIPTPLAGRPVSAAPEGTLVAKAVRFFARVLARRVPISLGDSFVNRRGETVLYRSVILPVDDDGEGVDALVCAANSRLKDASDGGS